MILRVQTTYVDGFVLPTLDYNTLRTFNGYYYVFISAADCDLVPQLIGCSKKCFALRVVFRTIILSPYEFFILFAYIVLR